MKTLARVILFALLTLAPSMVVAGPAEDANAAVDRWSAAYSTNEPDAIVNTYWPNAILLGTVSPIISEGADAIRVYFSASKGRGNKNSIGERRTIVLDDNAVVVTGFYVFTRVVEGKAVPGPSRFTMLAMKRNGEWRIAHHHSSPHVQPKN